MWYNATIVQKVGENIYGLHIHQLDVAWRRHALQLQIIKQFSGADDSVSSDTAVADFPAEPRICVPFCSSQMIFHH